ncbi:MAG: SAM-dependent chlorinase/fluorinase [Candidatus Brocadia sp.]|nr:SAM-dependent chlorinase/fluorinase [Candidatus Brocadia sp.]
MRQSQTITLLTDFGNQDAYVGIMKGVIAGINPLANIIDICHNTPPQDIFHGAYLLYTSYNYFPKGTIHVAVVDPGVGSRRDVVCVETQEHIFLVPDNGILSFVVQKESPKGIFRVTNNRYFLPSPSNTFHGRDVFAPVAAHLSLGIKPRQLGNKINKLEQLDIPGPEYKETGKLEGRIIYIDRFGNLVTNITREHITQYITNQSQLTTNRDKIPPSALPLRKGRYAKQSPAFPLLPGAEKMIRKYAIKTTIGKKKIRGLSKTYTDVKAGEPLVLLGSADFLEISINQGNAQKYFKMDRGKKIMVEIGAC